MTSVVSYVPCRDPAYQTSYTLVRTSVNDVLVVPREHFLLTAPEHRIAVEAKVRGQGLNLIV